VNGVTPAGAYYVLLMREEQDMKVRPLFAWYDMWVGVFWDRKSRKLYVLPLPCLGFVIDFNRRNAA
jgi:hypothetical protein